jgi:hypothetical protein
MRKFIGMKSQEYQIQAVSDGEWKYLGFWHNAERADHANFRERGKCASDTEQKIEIKS